MKSNWSHLKSDAIKFRKQGKSLPFIHEKLRIPKSTLHYWLRDIKLTDSQTTKLRKNWEEGLVRARVEAVKWHNAEKAKRIQLAEAEALDTLSHIDLNNIYSTELALALLYLGEGTKAKDETGIGSSDPFILKFFVSCLRTIYNVPAKDIKGELHLRADQDPVAMTKYWSKELGIPTENFTKPYLDVRTKGTVTYSSYKGVCLVRCGRVAIQRKLVYIAKHFCSKYPMKGQ